MQQTRTIFQRQELKRFEVERSIHIVLFQSVAYHHTWLILMNKRDFVFSFLRTTIHTKVYIFCHWIGTKHFILPIFSGITLIDIVFVSMPILIIESSRVRTFLTRIFILHQYKFVRVHHIQFVRKFFGLHVGIQTNDNTSFNGTFGCHQNDTVCTTCTIDGRRGCIFQHLDRFNIGRRNIVQTVYFKSVQYDKRTIILCDRAATTHQNLDFSIRRTVYSRHLYTR